MANGNEVLVEEVLNYGTGLSTADGSPLVVLWLEVAGGQLLLGLPPHLLPQLVDVLTDAAAQVEEELQDALTVQMRMRQDITGRDMPDNTGDRRLCEFRRHFPGYPESDLPEIPEEWNDQSSDCSLYPSWVVGHMRIFVEFADPKLREDPESPRFSVCDERVHWMDELLATDNWQEVLAFVEANHMRNGLQ
ncbi:hypothetical protein K32_44430 [Kaistia sp. 32K]|uniref:hypothetical protein n=1 Tax=Kaistia sp. 32K TaxID=2795690 RepID=UPI00191642E7|nr:hypothetical protein [Kaistia sp. 32K]BCP55826.1 hypothetical protein K32_44430 [Kaistia sp. 32K]